MELAYARDAPFVICPCCTAKSLTRRTETMSSNDAEADGAYYDMSASFRRSGATGDITYPRSRWLGDLINLDEAGYSDEYVILAKVADVGLGPQTPSKQREQQRRAKEIVELDRLASGSERRGYATRLLRMRGHDPLEYGKGELLLGARGGTAAADAISDLLVE